MTRKPAATSERNYRRFLLMRQFAAAEVGSRIQQARLEAGHMTQRELADLLNVSARSVQDYEAGIRMPWKHFRELETIFKKPMEWFLHGEMPEEEEQDAGGPVGSRLDRIEAALLEQRLVTAEILRLIAQHPALSEQDDATANS